ncbi:hypothetical protein Mal52_59880 [Symmachiella dynata]|uniref:Uncharacterized protein n=1 Tax=Symmachiella dynata TaxID=2527995 RepID=A0A517ZYB6_9PLAN|nr:hypothetical protein [Symmachiella dynata]QDU47457.1 hypothetical protein Mal52_59880 [Symmachiella dynata]
MAIHEEDPNFLAGFLRIWIAFSVTSFVTAIGFSLFFHDNLLRSDDPYLAGALAGGFGAFFTFCAVIAAAYDKSAWKRRLAFLASVGISVVLLLLWDWMIEGSEGHGMPTFFAILALGSGILAFPLLRLDLTLRTVILTSVPGFLVGAGYCCAANWMAMR